MSPSLTRFIFLAIALGGASLAQSQTTTADQSQITITRRAGDPLVQNVGLSKNFFRTEDYQAEYDVQVPYEAEETYYVDVPYSAQEAYDDIEYDWDNERVCRTQNEPQRDCWTDTVCDRITWSPSQKWLALLFAEAQAGDGRVTNPDGRVGSGGRGDGRVTNPDGCVGSCNNDGRITNPNGRVDRRCRQVQRCETNWRSREVCNWERVQRSRTVTKYRTVTRYRQEARTRTVTRYRTETRCCVTKTREVFDHQWAAQVRVEFPLASTLIGNETEKFSLELTGTETQPALSVTALDTIFAYQPVVTVQSSSQFQVEMNLIPKYKKIELGEGSLQGLTLTESGDQAVVSFVDQGARHRVGTRYTLSVEDVTSGSELARATWVSDGETQEQRASLSSALKSGTVVLLKIRVQRSSLLLDGPVDFQQDLQLQVQEDPPYNAAPYMDASQTGKFVLSGRKAKTQIWFRDLTKDIPQVKTRYEFSLTDVKGNAFANGVFERKNLKLDDGRMKLRLKEDFGVADDVLEKLKPGFTVIINYKAVRQGSRFKPNPFVISKKVTLEIED